MSARLTATQNKVRLIAVFLFTVMLVLLLRVYQGLHTEGASAAVNPRDSKASVPLDESLFVGIRHASSAEIRQVLPSAQGKPAVLYLGSRLCYDCKRLSPLVVQLMSQHPEMGFKKLDVQADQHTEAAILRTFKPVSVPVVVFINQQGEIRNVLYDYQSPDVLANALKSIQRPVSPKPVTKVQSPLKH